MLIMLAPPPFIYSPPLVLPQPLKVPFLMFTSLCFAL